MLLTGTPVTVDRDGSTLPVDRIRPGQTLWNPLTEKDVEVVRVLRRSPVVADKLPKARCPHILPEGALGPGHPDRNLRVLPRLRCFGLVRSANGRTALQPAPVSDLCRDLVRSIGPREGDAIFLPLPRTQSVILVCGLLVCLDLTWRAEKGPVGPGGQRSLPHTAG
ncbi:hypothetical protein HKCCSP123_17075 [Rhodobacterales bacterium HKCCSP123]|nr:hypothetical protein [Rhodobacterales bacterium HKCCSP123]